MTTSEPDNQAEENVLAYAAVTLCGNSTQGEAPQWHEIAAWREGTLSSHRSAQVLSHVANDPEVFQQWLDIVDAEHWVEEQAKDARAVQTNDSVFVQPTSSVVESAIRTVRAFFQQPIPLYGGAFAAVMLALLVAPLLRTGDGLSLQQQLDRSTDAYIDTGNGFTGAPPVQRNTRNLGGLFDDLSVNDIERLYIQDGQRVLYEKLQASQSTSLPVNQAWQDWLAELPDESVDCSLAIDSSHCATVADDFLLLGQWSLINTIACEALADQRTSIAESELWSEQYSVYERIRSLPAITTSQIFAPLLPPLDVQVPEALCSVATSIVAAAQ